VVSRKEDEPKEEIRSKKEEIHDDIKCVVDEAEMCQLILNQLKILT
jgi:Mg2+ and Co2+ transporter CorA